MKPLSFPSPPRRILIIKPSAIGDVIHALPVLNLLRRRWPAARISWLATPPCTELLEGHPQLNEVIAFPRRQFGQGWRNPKIAAALFHFMRDLRRRKFDWVIDLQGLFRSGWLAMQTQAPLRIGFANARELAWIFYTHRVAIRSPDIHAVDRYIKLASALGCDHSPVEFPIPIDEADRQYIGNLLPKGKRFAVLLPGTNWATKRWPVEHFAAIVQPLRERFGLNTIIAGGPDAAELATLIPDSLNLVGKTNLRQLAALLEKADLVIANDSGPMHLAAALARPLVALYGPTNPLRTGPYARPNSVIRLDIPCSPCYSRHCSHQSCLRWLGIEPVLALAEKQMGMRENKVVGIR